MIFIPAIIAGGLISTGKFIYDLNKATDLDDEAFRLTHSAASEIGEATAKKWETEEAYDQSLKKLIDRKKSIVNNIFPSFLTVYSKIMKIEFDFGQNDILKQLDQNALCNFNTQMQAVISFPYHTLTNQQFVSDLIVESIKGTFLGANPLISMVSGSIKTDSENKKAEADEYSKAADSYKNTITSRAKAYDALIWQFETLSMQIAKLNGFLLRCTRYVDSLIKKNGYKSSAYSDKELEYVMLCINLAALLKECLITPLLNSDNELTRAAFSLIRTTDKHLSDIEIVMKLI